MKSTWAVLRRPCFTPFRNCFSNFLAVVSSLYAIAVPGTQCLFLFTNVDACSYFVCRYCIYVIRIISKKSVTQSMKKFHCTNNIENMIKCSNALTSLLFFNQLSSSAILIFFFLMLVEWHRVRLIFGFPI